MHTFLIIGSVLGFFLVFLVSISATLCASHNHFGQVEPPVEAFLVLVASRGPLWRHGNKRPMPRNVPVGKPGQRWAESCSWSWNNQDLSDEETFARLTRVSSDGSNGLAVDAPNRTDDGSSFCDPQQFLRSYPPRRNHLGNRRQIQVHQETRTHQEDVSSKGQTNCVRFSGDCWTSPMEGTTSDVKHPVQYGVVPERIALPRPGDGILSGYDEDVSSIPRIPVTWPKKKSHWQYFGW